MDHLRCRPISMNNEIIIVRAYLMLIFPKHPKGLNKTDNCIQEVNYAVYRRQAKEILPNDRIQMPYSEGLLSK